MQFIVLNLDYCQVMHKKLMISELSWGKMKSIHLKYERRL